ncbi:MAG: YggT family protein [Desulfobulbaceae bacterium]|nr:YggT family protein [Desulfobulbaceae bacterium]
MFVIGNFISALASLIDFMLAAYMWIIIGRALISWVNPDPYNPIVKFLREVTDPLLVRIRRVVPLAGGGVDFSPMILIAAIYFLRGFLIPTLQHLSMTLG